MTNSNDYSFFEEFKNQTSTKSLIQGIGNPLREDDGAGFEFIERIKTLKLIADLDWVFQLQIENAEQWSKYDQVVIVDAHIDQSESVKCTKLDLNKLSIEDFRQFSSHSLSPELVYFLCREHFQKTPKVFLLTLKGERFGIGEGLSNTAMTSLDEAIKKIWWT